MATLNQVTPNRGSDVPFVFNCKDSDGEPVSLFDHEVHLLDVSTELTEYLTASITDAALGVIEARIEWHTSLVAEKSYYFRVQVRPDVGDDFSTPLIEVKYQ